jgi:hypothetical protein
MSRHSKLRIPLTFALSLLATSLLATFALIPAASAKTTSSAPSPGSYHLVVSSVPLPGTSTGIAARTGIIPNISRVNCSSGNDAMWVRLYLDNGGAECYGFTGSVTGINDGPAYQLCSGNNHGTVYTDLGAFNYAPINSATPNYYYYLDDEGDVLSFYVHEVHNVGWSGSAEC